MGRKKKARVRRTYAQLFLDALDDLAPGGERLVKNKTLRERLGWDEDRYTRVRRELADQKKIVIGRGWGGLVGLATSLGAKGLSVFVSYTHTDETFKTDLLKHLEPLRRLGLIEAWHDRKIRAGDEWDKVISANLKSADIILLLVSIDFINSQYCYDVEMEVALDMHEEKKATVIPIILRPCMWQQTPFAKLQALPRDARAVAIWPDRDEALVNVAEGVRRVAEDRLDL
ncbi:MAG TPA: toll/interleukin-1 receptor domain-containing protein [Acidobacteriaceae bacterium]|nr:toll/interleukin-1 receptor domain-containing protein [Acidobacteriaceae bacterium]